MQTNTSKKYIVSLLSKVLGVTIIISASFHIITSVITAFAKHHLYYISPIRFLGINNFWPRYQDSNSATFLGWGVLILLYISLSAWYIRKNDPELITRLKSTMVNSRETRQFIYETKDAIEIEVFPLSLLIKNMYRLKDLLVSSST